MPAAPTGQPDAGNVTFTLSIHDDVLAQPGETLWHKTFSTGDFTVRPYLSGIQGGWYDPNSGLHTPSVDTVVWQYNFDIDISEAFMQLGSPADPNVYWLGVQAVSGDQAAVLGWKTSMQGWLNSGAAAWATGTEPDITGWQETQYPNGHPMYPETVNMAFAITSDTSESIPEPATILLFGIGSIITLTRKKRFSN